MKKFVGGILVILVSLIVVLIQWQGSDDYEYRHNAETKEIWVEGKEYTYKLDYTIDQDFLFFDHLPYYRKTTGNYYKATLAALLASGCRGPWAFKVTDQETGETEFWFENCDLANQKIPKSVVLEDDDEYLVVMSHMRDLAYQHWEELGNWVKGAEERYRRLGCKCP